MRIVRVNCGCDVRLAPPACNLRLAKWLADGLPQGFRPCALKFGNQCIIISRSILFVCADGKPQHRLELPFSANNHLGKADLKLTVSCRLDVDIFVDAPAKYASKNIWREMLVSEADPRLKYWSIARCD